MIEMIRGKWCVIVLAGSFSLTCADTVAGDAGIQPTIIPLDLPFSGPPCPPDFDPEAPRVQRLSELFGADVSDNQCAVEVVQKAIFDMGQGGTLIVDRRCELDEGLRIPSRFTMKGTGIGVSGIIQFMNDGIGLSVCQEPPRGFVTIANLDLFGRPQNENSVGIALANINIVFITNVRVSGFRTGILGVRSESVFIRGSNVSDNDVDNIRITDESNGWRIRDGLISQAGQFGINVSTSNDLLVHGVRMESNSRAAIRTEAHGTRIINNRFEGNGRGNFPLSPSKPAILVTTTALDTRILTNFFDVDCILDEGATTERAFNIPSSRNVAECTTVINQTPLDCSDELVECRSDAHNKRTNCVIDCAEDTDNYVTCARECSVTTQIALAQCRANFKKCHFCKHMVDGLPTGIIRTKHLKNERFKCD